MTDNTTYKVLRRTTEGWTLVDNLNAVHLTKEQCDQVLMNLVNEWTTISAPCLIGEITIGVNVLSTTNFTLCFFPF